MTDFALQQIVKSDIDMITRTCNQIKSDKYLVLSVIKAASATYYTTRDHNRFLFFASLPENSKPVNMELFMVRHILQDGIKSQLRILH